MSEQELSPTDSEERWPITRKLEEIEPIIGSILSQYGSRSMAYVVVYSWLSKLPKGLAKEWLNSMGITTPKELKKKLAYQQAKHRKIFLANEKKQAEQREADFEAWLFEKDPAAAAELIVSKMRRDILNKMKDKDW